jgi:hypothetical protein
MEEDQREVRIQSRVATKVAMGLSYAWFVPKDPGEQHRSRSVV